MAKIDNAFWARSLGTIQATADSLLGQAHTEADVIAVASNLCYVASQIYEHMGGAKLAAVQFYHVADTLARRSNPE